MTPAWAFLTYHPDMRIVYATDVHGNRSAYKRLFEIPVEHDCAGVVLGGDLLPKRGIIRDVIVEQRTFVQSFLAPLISEFRNAHPDVTLLWLLGNDDWAANEELFLDFDRQGVARYLHNRVVIVQGKTWAGYSNVPITPFGNKDWERYDSPGAAIPVQFTQAVRSDGMGRKVPIDLVRELSANPTIEQDLRVLASACVPRDTIFVVHSPPHDTALDLTSRREHVGSRALRRFIEEHSPPLTLHGHVHESPRMSGSIVAKIGPTVSLNPGASEHTLAAVLLETDDPERTIVRVI